MKLYASNIPNKLKRHSIHVRNKFTVFCFLCFQIIIYVNALNAFFIIMFFLSYFLLFVGENDSFCLVFISAAKWIQRSTYIRVSALVSPGTFECNVFMATFMHDEWTNCNWHIIMFKVNYFRRKKRTVSAIRYRRERTERPFFVCAKGKLSALPWHWNPCFPKPLHKNKKRKKNYFN